MCEQFGSGLSCIRVTARGPCTAVGSAAFSRVAAYTQTIFRQKDLARAVKFAARSILHWRATQKWLGFIDGHPALSAASEDIRASLADKIYRPFARRELDVAGRAILLRNHYLILTRLLPLQTLIKLTEGSKFRIAQLSGKKGQKTYSLYLGRLRGLGHHGELTISLICSDVKGLAHLTVNCMLDEKGRTVLLLSGLKGPGFSGKEQIVCATRDLSGLRPKRAVMEAAYSLARFVKAERIVATGESNLVSQAKEKWRAKVFADYNGFWQEFSPTRLAHGDYELPMAPPRRSVQDVPAKKRKDWHRRATHLDAISVQVEQALGKLAGT